MKNILLITNIYPNNDPNYKGTKVCHSFAKEWLAMGYNVRVVHFDSLFPRAFYLVGKIFNESIRAKTGCVAYSSTPRRITSYNVDDIPVIFAPLKKTIPHRSPSKKTSRKAFESVCNIMEEDGFVPDAVAGHFVLPQLEMLYRFKQRYPKIKTCMVLHGNGGQIPATYPKEYHTYMDAIDVWGFRSCAFQAQFEKKFGKRQNEFLCYSGVPEEYIGSADRNFTGGVRNFVFVGSLYELKNVDITLRALNSSMQGKAYHFDIVGSGAENDNLHKLVDDLKMQEHVTFHGQMKRDDAQKVIDKADCFVMVSTREAFGLVYVEAMAKGLITVATKGQGIDGVIINGENGFLCPSRDVEALASTISEICSLPEDKLNSISQKAISTASNLSDRKVAETYLNNLLKK